MIFGALPQREVDSDLVSRPNVITPFVPDDIGGSIFRPMIQPKPPVIPDTGTPSVPVSGGGTSTSRGGCKCGGKCGGGGASSSASASAASAASAAVAITNGAPVTTAQVAKKPANLWPLLIGFLIGL